MTQRGTYRSKFEERDLSGYIESTFDATGAMVIKSPKGYTVPKRCTREDDIFTRFGIPSAENPELFEAVAYVQQAPLWVASAVSEDAKWGGVYVTESEVVPFTGGQVNPDNFFFNQVSEIKSETIGTGDGTTTSWSYSLDEKPLEFSLRLKKGTSYLDAKDKDGDITGSDIDGTGSIDYDTGAISFDTVSALSSGVVLTAEYDYNVDKTAEISHVFFSASPYEDDIQINVQNVSGQRFIASIYDKNTGNLVEEQEYSLIKEKDGFGGNLYIYDVFDQNDYVIPKVNPNYAGDTPTLSYDDGDFIDFGGGRRGSDPTTADRLSVWEQFRKPNKYQAKILMDTDGTAKSEIMTIIQNYQYYSFGITVIPMGNTVEQMVEYRNDLGIDFDGLALYCNWRKIYDRYNDSFAWISNVGCIGKKFAQIAPMYDGLSPAGIDENGYGGQIRDYRTIEVEHDFDDFDLKKLDRAQINPLIFDQEGYGLMIYGDRTLQVDSSDTSFIHTRRIDNYIIEKIIKNVMRLREFKNNTPTSQLKARAMVEEFLAPIVAKELITEVEVICDHRNNTASVRTQRKFILDVIKKSTVNNQKTLLRLTRVGQGAVISEITPV